MNRRHCLGGFVAATGAVGLSSLEGAWAQSAAIPMIAGPDPDTHIVKFKAPRGSVDTHTHIFGPNARYPYAANRSYTPPDAPLEMFAALHAKIGIDRAVIVNATVHGTDNRPVTDAIAVSGGRYKGIANIVDTISDKELEALDKGGIRGCRFTFLARLGGMPDMTKFNRIVDKIKGLGWHVDLYLESTMMVDFAPILRQLPVSYVIDHMGAIKAAQGLDQPAMLALLDLQRDEKCWVKISGPERMSASGPPFHDAVPFAQMLIAGAPDRVIWGSDWPHPNVKIMPNDGDLVDLIPLYAPDEKIRHKLLVDNPVRLFGFAAS
jgi:predicted TIM-barrel fold metal-dependent hydrolase